MVTHGAPSVSTSVEGTSIPTGRSRCPTSRRCSTCCRISNRRRQPAVGPIDVTLRRGCARFRLSSPRDRSMTIVEGRMHGIRYRNFRVDVIDGAGGGVERTAGLPAVHTSLRRRFVPASEAEEPSGRGRSAGGRDRGDRGRGTDRVLRTMRDRKVRPAALPRRGRRNAVRDTGGVRPAGPRDSTGRQSAARMPLSGRAGYLPRRSARTAASVRVGVPSLARMCSRAVLVGRSMFIGADR
jgi:hypothetical protein